MPATDAGQMEMLRNLLRMEGWRTVMKPIILERARVVKDLAFAIPSERPKPYSEMDDTTATSVLRGEAKALLWVANIFEQTVAAEDANRRREELTRHELDGSANPTVGG